MHTLALALLLASSPALAQDTIPELDAERRALAEERRQLEAEREAARAEREALRREIEAAREVSPPPRARSGGPRIAYGDDIHIGEDEVVDDVASYGGDVLIEGHVLGDVTAFGGDVLLESGARVDGDTVAFGGRVEVEDGAVVHGDRIAFADEGDGVARTGGFAAMLSSLYHRLVFVLSFAGAGVLVVGLFPQRVARIAESVESSPVRALVAGVLSSVFLLVASLLFAITVIGLPIAFLLVALLGLAWLMGFVGLCQAVGDRLPFQQKHHGRWFAFLVGTLLVSFLGALPWVGWLVVLGASVLGMGAAIGTRLGGRA